MDNHVESALYDFVDRPLPLDAVLALSAEALAEDIEVVASALDRLTQAGRLVFADGLVCRADAAPRRDMKKLYQEWLAIVHRHPEWKAKLHRPIDRDVDVNLSDPSGTMRDIKDVFQYDESSVRPEDREEFKHFSEIDAIIEEYERKNPPQDPRQAALRAMARYRMLGGMSYGIGLVRQGKSYRFLPVQAEVPLPTRGDLVYSIAQDICRQQHNCELFELSVEDQSAILTEAEQVAMQKQPIMPIGQFGDMGPAPAADQNAPEGYEKVTDQTGKSFWRPKNQPGSQVKIERPDENM